MQKTRIMWVATWEGTDINSSENDIVIFLPPSMNFDTVGETLELLYMVAKGHKDEKITYATKRKNLSPTFRYRVSSNGTVSCGHNPQLVARRVSYVV